MAAIKPTEAIASKWSTVTPSRSSDYEAGVQDPGTDWATAAKAGNDAWKAGVQSAIQRDAFSKGVTSSGTQAWQSGALTKGVRRWGEGVGLAADAYARGFAPFREAIARLSLPPRFARRDPRNLDRVKAVVEALVKAKTSPTS